MPSFRCAVCGMAFLRADFLTRHMRTIHTGERPGPVLCPGKCPVCDRSLARDESLTQHMQRTHGYPKKPFECPICKSSFARNESLTRHMRTHGPKRPYDCPICNRCFARKESLDEHILSHTRTQHTKSLRGITNTVSTVTSSRGTAIVTTVQSPRSLVATTSVSQASGTVTVIHPSVELERDPGNECPICFDSLNDREAVTTPCCESKFHIDCLCRLIRGTVLYCPHCREMLTRKWLISAPAS